LEEEGPFMSRSVTRIARALLIVALLIEPAMRCDDVYEEYRPLCAVELVPSCCRELTNLSRTAHR
jgi:hypothetical protein